MLSALCLAIAGCRPAREPATPATTTTTTPHGEARVILSGPTGRESAVTVEVARTPAELERGLMNRRSLPQDAGMLFVFPETDEHSFWMKNTLIPLDMIFIAEDRSVVGIVANAEPLTLTARSAGRCRYVLEVNGGWAERHGVAAGDKVTFENLVP